jgi:hypothetical protein
MGGYLSSQREPGSKCDLRHTAETGPFCVICGGPFDIEGEIYNIDPKDPQFQVRHSPSGHIAFFGVTS